MICPRHSKTQEHLELVKMFWDKWVG